MGIGIHNDRKEWDGVALKSSVWSGMEQGICRHYFIKSNSFILLKDEYPSKDGSR